MHSPPNLSSGSRASPLQQRDDIDTASLQKASSLQSQDQYQDPGGRRQDAG
jgi:hypothetical protein